MTTKPYLIGILETGRPPPELADSHTDYPGMVERWLSPMDAEFRSFAVLDDQFPASPDDADLWVITGSRFGVYEDHPWIAELEDFVRACQAASRPMVGICFGHQIIAQALGGTVQKSDKGWGLGVHEYQKLHWPTELGETADTLRMQAFHQDQVTALPPGGTPIATSEFCEYAAMWYPGFALTFQGHPEFGPEFVADLVRARRALFTDQQVETALDSVAENINPQALVPLIQRGLIPQKEPMK